MTAFENLRKNYYGRCPTKLILNAVYIADFMTLSPRTQGSFSRPTEARGAIMLAVDSSSRIPHHRNPETLAVSVVSTGRTTQAEGYKPGLVEPGLVKKKFL
jgi:hypothetical protein